MAQGSTILPDLTTGGTAFSSGGANFGDGPASNAFDDNDQTKIGMNVDGGNVTAATPAIVGYTFAGNVPALVLSYSLTSANDSPNRDPLDFRLEGSNNAFATAGTVVDTRTGVLFNDGPDADTNDRFETLFFNVQTPGTTAFSSYRLVSTDTRGLTNGDFQFAELQLFATPIPEPASLGLLGLGALGLLARRRRA